MFVLVVKTPFAAPQQYLKNSVLPILLSVGAVWTRAFEVNNSIWQLRIISRVPFDCLIGTTLYMISFADIHPAFCQVQVRFASCVLISQILSTGVAHVPVLKI
jgi:hypothetical protein